MAVGDFVYVGKSRVRRMRKEKRKQRKEDKLTRASPSGGRSPCTGQILYAPLTSHHDDVDNVSLVGYDVMRDVDADSCSIGSSGSEDLLPLLDFDLALELRPHTDKYIPRVKMPFELFKKKEKKKPVAEKKEEPKTNADDAKKDTNNDVPEKVAVKDDATAPQANEKVAAQVPSEAVDTQVEAKDAQTTETETVDGVETMIDETEKHGTTEETQLLEESAKPDQKAVKEVPEEKKKEEKEEEKEKEAEKGKEEPVKTDISDKTEAVHANGTMASLRKEPLKLEKVNADDDDERMGVVCCNIL